MKKKSYTSDEEERKRNAAAVAVGEKKKSMLLDEMYISSASRRSRKVIKQLTSIEYSLVISRPPDGQVHVIVRQEQRKSLKKFYLFQRKKIQLEEFKELKDLE